MGFDPGTIRGDFPALDERVRGNPVVYLDNACMTLKPEPVIEAMVRYYRSGPGCHGRTDHLFGRRTTEVYDGAREEMRRFLGAKGAPDVVLTRNTTESINVVSRGLGLGSGDVVLSSGLEHNSNLLPWQVLAEDDGVEHRVFTVKPDTTFDPDAFREALDAGGVKLVSVLWTSNLTGVSFPVGDICEMAHARGALVLLDAAQVPLCHAIDVGRLGVDFLALSVHKMLGPTGVGILYVAPRHQDRIRPLVVGGETVLDATYTHRRMAPAPDRFEAGLRDYAGAAGAAAAARYVTALGPGRVREHLVRLNTAATQKLLAMDGIRLLGPEDPEARGGILNFVARGIRSEDITRILNEAATVMVRFGRHCVHAWYNAVDIPDSVRVSFGPYNTLEEVERFVAHLGEVLTRFR